MSASTSFVRVCAGKNLRERAVSLWHDPGWPHTAWTLETTARVTDPDPWEDLGTPLHMVGLVSQSCEGLCLPKGDAQQFGDFPQYNPSERMRQSKCGMHVSWNCGMVSKSLCRDDCHTKQQS